MQLAEDSGLTVSVRGSKQVSPNLAISEDWFAEALFQGSSLLRDLAGFSEEIRNAVDFYSSKYHVNPAESKRLSRPAKGFRFLGALNDAADLAGKLSECLGRLPNERIFDPSSNIVDLLRRPPNAAVRMIRSNLNVSLEVPSELSGRYKNLHLFVCHSVMNNKSFPAEQCVQELAKLEDCVRGTENVSGSQIVGRNVLVRPWLRAIQRLTDCEIQGKPETARVSCKSGRDVPRNVRHRVRYIYETILNRKIRKRSALHRVSNELGSVLSRSDWGKQFVNELCEYVAIYREGCRQLLKLAGSGASRKEETAARRREISEALETYKRGVLLRTVGTIGRVHQTVSGLEQFLMNGIKFALNETWQSHVRILSCLTDWMTKLFELYSGMSESNADAESVVSTSSPLPASFEENWYSRRPLAYYANNSSRDHRSFGTRSDVARAVDRSMRNLMRSMNTAVRLRTANEKSSLACLANNLLLAAMFMETISFVSALFCFGNKSGMHSAEMGDEWRSRKRRSFLWGEEQNLDIFDRFRLQAENITMDISNEKNDTGNADAGELNYEEMFLIETRTNVTINKQL